MMKRCHVTGMETGSCDMKTSRVTSPNGYVAEAEETETETDMSLNALKKCFTLLGLNPFKVFLPKHLCGICQNK